MENDHSGDHLVAATGSRISWSEAPTALPGQRRWPSPSSPEPTTTPCSSTGRPGWARPTSCTPSGTWPSSSTRDWSVRYITSERFLNDFIDSIRRKRVDDFKHRYRSTDVLLLDDVQFFEGKEQILEEFFHTFNTLYESGKQMVISSDRHPRNLSTLEDRLRSRFEWGLLTDIQPPDVETRLAILKRNAEFAPAPGAQRCTRVHRQRGLRQHP